MCSSTGLGRNAKITGGLALNLNPIIHACSDGDRILFLVLWWLWLDNSGPAIVTPATFATNIGDAITATFSPFAMEPNGFPLTHSLLSAPSVGTVVLTADGNFIYTRQCSNG